MIPVSLTERELRALCRMIELVSFASQPILARHGRSEALGTLEGVRGKLEDAAVAEGVEVWV